MGHITPLNFSFFGVYLPWLESFAFTHVCIESSCTTEPMLTTTKKSHRAQKTSHYHASALHGYEMCVVCCMLYRTQVKKEDQTDNVTHTHSIYSWCTFALCRILLLTHLSAIFGRLANIFYFSSCVDFFFGISLKCQAKLRACEKVVHSHTCSWS